MVKLEGGERIVHIARRHWFLFVSESGALALFALLPAALFLIPHPISVAIFAKQNIGANLLPLLVFFWSLWLMFLWALFALMWTDFYLDVWVITNHRVIDIEQAGLFNRKISSFRFDQIQDATVKISGLLATLIKFGTVELRTASNESFKFKGVADPTVLKERIMSEHHRVQSLRMKP